MLKIKDIIEKDKASNERSYVMRGRTPHNKAYFTAESEQKKLWKPQLKIGRNTITSLKTKKKPQDNTPSRGQRLA